jgi:hypothetical protein
VTTIREAVIGFAVITAGVIQLSWSSALRSSLEECHPAQLVIRFAVNA